MSAIRSILVCCFAVASAASVCAQSPTPAGKLAVDWAVPESPAFTVLGVTPQTVTRPSSAQQLATALLSGVDQNGNFQSGIAVDAQPYMLWYGHKVTYTDYKNNRVTQFLSRAQLSLATTKGATDGDKSARLAAGLRLTIFDLGDPYLDVKTAECLAMEFKKVLDEIPPPPGPDAPNENKEQRKIDMMAKVEPGETRCRKNQGELYRRTRWNNSSLIVGLAPSWITTTGNSSDLEANGGAIWASLGYGFEKVPGLEDNSQLIVHYRRRNKEQLPDPKVSGQFFEQDSDVVGVRWRQGTADATASLEYVFLRRHLAGRPDDNSSRLSIAAERHLTGNTWLALSFGSERGRDDGLNKAFVLSSFNWSLNHKTE